MNALYFRRPDRFLSEDALMDMNRRQRVGAIMNYYANLLEDPEAMEEYHAAARAHIAASEESNRLLQDDPIEITRQQVTFSNCRFYNNSYGRKISICDLWRH